MVEIADLILFAIEAAVKVARAGRAVYVEETIRKEVSWPLPMTFEHIGADARQFATALQTGSVHDKQRFDLDFRRAIVSNDDVAVIRAYVACLARGEVPKLRLPSPGVAGLASLATLSQWSAGTDLFPSPLQRIAGTLVEIGVDYFLHVPGAMSDSSRQGKLVRALLSGLDDVKFSEERWDSLAIALFTAGLDAFKDHPELFMGSQDQSLLLQTVTHGVAAELHERLAALQGPDALSAEDRMKAFGVVLIRGALTGSSRAVLSNPQVLGIKDGAQQELVQAVGGAFLDVVFAHDDPLHGLRDLASAGGLDKLLHAALKSAAENPDLFRVPNRSARAWLADLLKDLYTLYPEGRSLLDADLVANLAYIALDRGMTDLSPLLLEKLPKQNRPLATVVLTIVLQALVKPPGGGKPAVWRFDLTRADIEKVADGALAGIAQHPEWLYKDPDHRAMAAAGASLVLDVLSRLRGGDGGLLRTLVRSDCLAPLLSAVLVSNTMEVLEDLKDNNGKPMGPEPIAQAVTEIVAALVERGTSGIERVFTFDALADVMRALVHTGLLLALLSKAAPAGGSWSELVDRLGTALDRVRSGTTISVPELEAILRGGAVGGPAPKTIPLGVSRGSFAGPPSARSRRIKPKSPTRAQVTVSAGGKKKGTQSGRSRVARRKASARR
jgi:hypothetical protein